MPRTAANISADLRERARIRLKTTCRGSKDRIASQLIEAADEIDRLQNGIRQAALDLYQAAHVFERKDRGQAEATRSAANFAEDVWMRFKKDGSPISRSEIRDF